MVLTSCCIVAHVAQIVTPGVFSYWGVSVAPSLPCKVLISHSAAAAPYTLSAGLSRHLSPVYIS